MGDVCDMQGEVAFGPIWHPDVPGQAWAPRTHRLFAVLDFIFLLWSKTCFERLEVLAQKFKPF